jgi:hypothetical protein
VIYSSLDRAQYLLSNTLQFVGFDGESDDTKKQKTHSHPRLHTGLIFGNLPIIYILRLFRIIYDYLLN